MLKLTKDLVKILISEHPGWAAFAAFLLLCLLALAAWSLRPPPPDKVVQMYVDRLNDGDCNGAYKMISEKRKDRDPDVDSLESFRRTICRDVSTAFAKLFVAPEDMAVKIYAGDADVDYFLCVLPVGYIRRVCSKHSASLVRESRRWKISSLEFGSWDALHTPRNEKGETLIPPYSPENRDK